MFQGTSNLMSPVFRGSLKTEPEISQIETGTVIITKENIYQHGRKYTAAEVVERDWRAVEHCPFIRYIQRKYKLYGLNWSQPSE